MVPRMLLLGPKLRMVFGFVKVVKAIAKADLICNMDGKRTFSKI
jgi:hypothetical protein